MKKKRIKTHLFHGNGCKKCSGVCKNLILLLFVFNLNLNASVFSQHQKLSLQLQNASVEELISAIKRQCDVGFIYDYEKVKDAGGITVNVKDGILSEVLQKALDKTGLIAEIENNLIIIKRIETQQKQPLAQTLKGQVTDEKGNPLPGVTVVIKGTAIGVTTDKEGKFHWTLPDWKGKVLVFTFVGMESKEILVKEPAIPMVVMMETAVETLKEAVVTGIYTRTKESFTGSSTTYTAKELKYIGNQNVLQSLKTLDPAFAILENNQFGSDPNHLPDINVRGKTSVIGLKQEYDTDPNQPLFILDGFESTLAVITDLSMDRVESITVLKDAAATAIYGSKAANGVIVVETKRPEAGRIRVNYSGNLALNFADLSDYNLMDSEEKMKFERLSGYYGKLDANDEIIDEEESRKYYNRLAEIRRGVDTYWLNEPLRFATTHQHNLFVEGGDNRMRYGLGFSYGKTMGVMKGSDREVINGNIRLIYRWKSLAFTNYTNIDYTMAKQESVTFSDFSRANPYYRKTDENGNIIKILESYKDTDYNSETMNKTIYVYNPLYNMELNNKRNTSTFGFRNNFEVDWRVVDELRIRGRFSLSKSIVRGENFTSPFSTEYEGAETIKKGSYSESNNRSLTYDGDFSITYGKMFAEDHMVNAVAGMRVNSSSSLSSGYVVRGFLDESHPNPAFASGYAEGSKPSYSQTERRSASYYFNAGYAYRNRYLLDVNFRSDGSSVFGVDNKFTTTWALGLGWNVHNEGFFKNMPWLSYLKVRASMGNPGNQNFDAYMAMNVYSYNKSYPLPFSLSALISSWGNRNLEWQKTLDKNIGVDFEVLDRRLRISFDYFNKTTDPLLVYVQIPSSTGTTEQAMNVGKQVTEGLTATFNYVLVKKEEIHWSVNFNARHIKSTFSNIGTSLDKFNQDNRSRNLQRYYDGGSPSDMWSVRSAGIDPATGREIFIKKDGSQTFIHDYDDEVVVGNTEPKVEGVVGTSFYYKGVSISMNFRYRLGGQIFLSTLYDKVENISEASLYLNQDRRALYDRWQKPGDNAKFKAISLTESTPMSSRFVADENTFSGESISIGYETQAKWLRHIGASSLSIRGYMNEIFRISTVKNERGIDYPFARNISFSLSARF